MYTSKTGKVYANPAYGKAMDAARDADPGEKKPAKKADAKKADSKDSKDTKNSPAEVKIVISQDPSGKGYQTDDGESVDSHPDVASLLDHVKNTLPPDPDSDSDDSTDPTQPSDPSTPSPSISDAVKSMMAGPSK